MEGTDPQTQAVFGEQAETWGLLSDFHYSGNGLSVILSQPAKGSRASLLGKEPSKTWPEWAGAEEGCRALQTIQHWREDHRQRQKMAYF